MSSDKISIIIPVYNVESFLPRCLDSVIHQTYKNLEIILVDDGSKDDSGKICDDYAKKDNRIIVIHKENGGVSSARNVGINIATGEYIGFVDSDDWIELDMYENMLQAIKEHNVPMVRCFYTKEEKISDEIIPRVYNENLLVNLIKEREEIFCHLINGRLRTYIWLLLIKKEYVKELLFNENIAMREDMVWMIELLCNIDSFYFIKNEYYHYYNNVNGACNSYNFKKRNISNTFIVYENIYHKLLDNQFMTKKIEENLAFAMFYRIYSDLSIYLLISKDKAFLKEILHNHIFIKIVKNINEKTVSYINRIIILLAKGKSVNMLYHFLRLRQNVRNMLGKV